MRIARHLDDGGKVNLPVTGNVTTDKQPVTPKPEAPPKVAKAPKLKRLTREERERAEREAKRREIAFTNFRTSWEFFFPRKPFPEDDAEVVYQRFLDGKIEGMERVGRGDNLHMSAVSSWMTSTFWELKKMHEDS
jgi:hypothetical protein